VDLGYSDATAFARAFRRWSGTSPARNRQERSAAQSTAKGGSGRPGCGEAAQ